MKMSVGSRSQVLIVQWDKNWSDKTTDWYGLIKLQFKLTKLKNSNGVKRIKFASTNLWKN